MKMGLIEYICGELNKVSHFIGLQKSPPHFTVVNEYWLDEGIKQLDNCFWFCTFTCVNRSQEVNIALPAFFCNCFLATLNEFD